MSDYVAGSLQEQFRRAVAQSELCSLRVYLEEVDVHLHPSRFRANLRWLANRSSRRYSRF